MMNCCIQAYSGHVSAVLAESRARAAGTRGSLSQGQEGKRVAVLGGASVPWLKAGRRCEEAGCFMFLAARG